MKKKPEPKKQSKVIKAKEKPKVEEKAEAGQEETPQPSRPEEEISQNSEIEENGTHESLHDIDESRSGNTLFPHAVPFCKVRFKIKKVQDLVNAEATIDGESIYSVN